MQGYKSGQYDQAPKGHYVELLNSGLERLSADVHHGPRGRHKIRFADVVAFFFSLHNGADEILQVLVSCSPAHEFVQIVVPNRKQTGTNFAVGGDADAAAVPAERMR